MRYFYITTIVAALAISISCKSEIQKCGDHYQKYNDFKSLQRVVHLVGLPSDTTIIKQLLGQPIDMGFEYRYLVDSTGPNDCMVGAVFTVNRDGIVTNKWIGEVCE